MRDRKRRGQARRFSDDLYRAAGVSVVDTADALYAQADVIAKVRPPLADEVSKLAPARR